MSKETRIICGHCGHLEQGPEGTEDFVYFPNRMVYLPGKKTPWKCPKCDNNHDVVIFGKNVVSTFFHPELANIPHVIESNKVWEDKEQAKAKREEERKASRQKYYR